MKSNQVKLEEQLNKMKGESFLYNTNQTTILSWSFADDTCTIVTPQKQIYKPISEIPALLEMFLPCDDEGLEIKPNKTQLAMVKENEELATAKVETLSTFGELRNIMMENIRKVQADKTYVEQANQINVSVKTIIDMAKTEISAIQTMHDITKGK